TKNTENLCSLCSSCPPWFKFAARSPQLAIVHELQVDPQVLRFQELDHGLELVLDFAGDAELVALNLCLDLQLRVADQLADLPRLVRVDPLADFYFLAHGAFGGRFDLAPLERL